QLDELAVDERQNPAVKVAHGDRHIPTETEGVVPVDPDVVARLGAAVVGDALELWSWEGVERPAFGAVRAGGGVRSVERLALAAVEAAEMAARKRGPVH